MAQKTASKARPQRRPPRGKARPVNEQIDEFLKKLRTDKQLKVAVRKTYGLQLMKLAKRLRYKFTRAQLVAYMRAQYSELRSGDGELTCVVIDKS